MGQAWHDLRFNIFLDVFPFLPLLWGTGWQQLAQITWRNIGDNTPVLYIIIIINY